MSDGMRIPARVCLAIPTFHRPRLLADLLAAIENQRFDSGAVTLDVVVLDNDHARSAEGVTAMQSTSSRFTYRYVVVAEAGLALVRNCAIECAASYDFLAMMDDDQLPEPQWLDALLAVQSDCDADAVIGPVSRYFQAPAARWVAAGKFFATTDYNGVDRLPIKDGNSGNCLIRVAALMHYGLRFEPRLNFAGGEDQYFFRSLAARGGRIVYAAAAIAAEPVPVERQRASYIVMRELRKGNSLAYCDLHIHGTPRAVAVRALKGFARIGLGLAGCIPRSVTRGRTGFITAACDISRGAGMLTGLFGWRLEPYRLALAARRPMLRLRAGGFPWQR